MVGLQRIQCMALSMLNLIGSAFGLQCNALRMQSMASSTLDSVESAQAKCFTGSGHYLCQR